MTSPDQYDSEKRGFLRRFGFVLGVAGITIVAGVIFVGQMLKKSGPPPRKTAEVTMVKIVSTPPPPPPPPQQPKMAEEKMVEQAPVDAAEQKPDEIPAPPSADLGTGIKGDGGPDAFGLSGNRGGGLIGGTGSRGSGSRWGWYAAQVQTSIADALRRHARTREADFRVEVRIWPDLTGRITRAQLVGSTGDSAVDAALKSEVLPGLQLKEPPPAGMPLPIVMRITARRPH